MKRLLFGLALALGGCVQPSAYAVHIDPGFDAGLQQLVWTALHDWTEAAGVYFQISISDAACNDDCFRFRPVDGMCGPSGAAIGWTSSDMHDVQIDTRLDQDEFLWVARHETGHALGLAHDVRGTVMCRDADCASWTITDRDVAAYRALR